MIIVTKDEKQYIPLLMGSFEVEEMGEFLTCIEVDEFPSFNMFNQLEHVKIHISDVKGFRGTYAFPPVIYGSNKSDTAENWKNLNPILPYGNVGTESDTDKKKIGDGVLRWNSLPYKK